MEVPSDLMERIYATLNYYANLTIYEGARVGGVLAGCPRGPKPTPEELTFEAAQMLKQVDTALKA